MGNEIESRESRDSRDIERRNKEQLVFSELIKYD